MMNCLFRANRLTILSLSCIATLTIIGCTTKHGPSYENIDGQPVAPIIKKLESLGVRVNAFGRDANQYKYYHVSAEGISLNDSELKLLMDLKTVEVLNLNGSRVAETGINTLAAMRRLKWLYLANTQITDHSLIPLANLADLQILDVSSTSVSNEGLATISKFEKLAGLDLSRTNVTLNVPSKLDGFRNLEVLRLDGTLVSDRSIKHLENIPTLVSVSLTDCKEIAGTGLEALAALPNLQTLILSGTKIDDETIESVLPLKNLRCIYLERTEITDRGLEKLAKMPALRELNLFQSQCTIAGVDALKVLLRDCIISLEERDEISEPESASETTYAPTRFERLRDVQYGTKHGRALLLDLIKPEQARNGIGIVWIIGDSYYSRREMIEPTIRLMDVFLSRGYTIFAVTHGSTPLFNVEECIEDVHRAVRFIRHHSKDYEIDPELLGSIGYSGAGHLAMMLGCGDGDSWQYDDRISTDVLKIEDPIERLGGKVQCVASFYGLSDLLNYGTAESSIIEHDSTRSYKGPFIPRTWNETTRSYSLVADPEETRKWLHNVSATTHVNSNTAPMYLLHGAKDLNVPIQQAYAMQEALTKVGIECQLVAKPEAGHGWTYDRQEMLSVANWFDKHLNRLP